MNYELSDELKMIRDTARDFTEKEVMPAAEDIEEKDEHPTDIYKKMGELGFTSVLFSQEYGGSNIGHLALAIIIEELARGSSAVASALFEGVYFCLPIALYGTKEQKKQFIPALCKGDYTFALGATEPNAGSDLASIRTSAKMENGKFRINGQKMFCTNAEVAERIVLAARTDKDAAPHKGISFILLDPKTKGVDIRKIRKLGNKGSRSNEVFLDDVIVSQDNLLGELNSGFKYIMDTLDAGRIGIASIALGTAQIAFEYALKYAKERIQFGQPIGKNQGISFKLADMAMEIEASRQLIYKAAWLLDNNKPCIKETSFAKLFATEVSERVCRHAIQIFGGVGYTMEFPLQRFYRDTRLWLIGEGASEIQRIVIAKQLGL